MSGEMVSAGEGGALGAFAEYTVVPEWERLPDGWTHRDVAGVAVGRDDDIYVLTRMDQRVIVYDRDGAFVRSWGNDVFSERPHGITIAPDGSVWITDEGFHVLCRFTPDGERLQTIGTPGERADTGADGTLPGLRAKLESIRRAGPPFNRPTNLAIAASGDLYVTDGYGNARVHQFTPDGELVRSWGSPGTGPGEFNLPHDICVTADDRVVVADRENDRIQVFDLTGRFIEEWTDVQRPTGLALHTSGAVVVAEMSWRPGHRSFTRGDIDQLSRGRVSLLDGSGRVLGRWPGGTPECAPGNFTEPHTVAIDSRDRIYVGEVTYSGTMGRDLPADCHTFQAFAPASSVR